MYIEVIVSLRLSNLKLYLSVLYSYTFFYHTVENPASYIQHAVGMTTKLQSLCSVNHQLDWYAEDLI